MGEVADMIEDGTLCERCGCLAYPDYITEFNEELPEPPGYTRLCPNCSEDCLEW